MNSKRNVLWALPVVALIGAAAACSSTTTTPGNSASSSSAKKAVYVVGYSQSNNAEPYRAQLNVQLEHFIKQYKNLKLLPISDAHQDSGTQVSQVQQFIAQKVDVLIVSPNEPAPLTAPVLQACSANIKVVVLDRTVNTNCYSSFIGGDNILIGKKAGELAAKLLPNCGNVVELQGILSDQPQIDRDTGFKEGIATNPKIKIIEHREAKWIKANATTITQQWLQQGLKIDVVYAENDPMALGAYLAASGAGKAKDIKFIGTDGLAIPDGGIRAVQLGQLAGTFIYPTGAEEAATAVEKLVTGGTVEKKQVLGTTAVTLDNAVSLYAQFDFSKKS